MPTDEVLAVTARAEVALALSSQFYAAARHGQWQEVLSDLCATTSWRVARLHVIGCSGAQIAVTTEVDVATEDASDDHAPLLGHMPEAPDHRWQQIDLRIDGAARAELWVKCDAAADVIGEAWQRLRPDLEQALGLALEIAEARWLASQLARDADSSPFGRIVIGRELAVRYANRAARAMAAAGDAFSLDEGKLVLRRASDQAALGGLMRQHAATFSDGGTTLNWLRRSGRWPYTVRVTPVGEETSSCFELTIIDREPDDPPCDPLLLTGFDLTQAEGRVVRGLLEGYTQEEIALKCGIVRGTVKLHAANAMKKLGVRRRPQLMRRLLAPSIARVPGVGTAQDSQLAAFNLPLSEISTQPAGVDGVALSGGNASEISAARKQRK